MITKNFKTSTSMSVLMMVILLFSNCTKDANPILPTPPITEPVRIKTLGAVNGGALGLNNAVRESGFAYYMELNVATAGDSQTAPTASTLKLYEDGVELGSAHSNHKDVRGLGKGRFSHWGKNLYFSASDNSDPKTNGRKYTYTIGTVDDTDATPPSVTSTIFDVSSATLESGFAYYIAPDFGVTSDTKTAPTASTVRLYENGIEIGPAHSNHEDIRNFGKGRFSRWNNGLYFSTSDNSDPRTNGRKYSYTVGTGTAIKIPTQTPQFTNANSPIGFAMQNGTTTGGQGGQTVTVNNLKDFEDAAGSSEPLIIQVSGNITGTGMITVLSDKTIVGLSGSSLNGVGLAIYRMNNIIIKNMRINKVVGGDCVTIKETSHHIWVDHCEFWQDRDHGWDYYDELLEVTDRSDYVTISNTKFHDSNIALLIGSGDFQTTDIGHLRVTLYGNYFYDISERQPCTRFGYMHVFNNYISNGSGYGIGATMGATVRTDNNYFENQHIPIFTEFNSKPGFVSGASTNIYKNCKANIISTAPSSWVPSYEYQSVLLAAADVPASVLANSGPKY